MKVTIASNGYNIVKLLEKAKGGVVRLKSGHAFDLPNDCSVTVAPNDDDGDIFVFESKQLGEAILVSDESIEALSLEFAEEAKEKSQEENS